MQRNSITLFQYAGFLLVVGLASAFYSAADRTAGWNPHGASGLYACGGAALIIAVMAWLVGKGRQGAAWVGLALAFLLFAYGGKTLFALLRDVSGNVDQLVVERAKKGDILTTEAAHRTILYKAGIFGAMAIFSLSAFLRLGLALARGKSA